MDEALERGHAGEIDLGVSHTDVSARDDTGELLRGRTEKAKRRKPRPSPTHAPSSQTPTTVTSLPAVLSPFHYVSASLTSLRPNHAFTSLSPSSLYSTLSRARP